jgi:hypothetical protein
MPRISDPRMGDSGAIFIFICLLQYVQARV